MSLLHTSGTLLRCRPRQLCRQLATAALSSDDAELHQLLHRSPLRTEHFQASLPRLPVPKLEDSVRRYLASQQVLLDGAGFDKTRAVAHQFAQAEGLELQRQLKAFDAANKHTSYVTDFWFDMYLRDRASVVLNYNPCLVLPPQPCTALAAQDVRATNAIFTSMRFQRTYKQALLAPQVFHLDAAKSDTASFRRAVSLVPNSLAFYMAALVYKAYPLDMSQFGSLFNSTRVPRPDKDELVATPDARHVLLMRRGHLYTFDVLDEAGDLVSPATILACVRDVLADQRAPAETPLGVLTANRRDTWSGQRERLLALGNTDSLAAVDGAAFVMCLDEAPEVDSHEARCRAFLHGDGANRWFDKSFSLILQEGGRTGLNFEHSWGDGVAVLRYVTELAADSASRPVVDGASDTGGAVSTVRRLEWRLDEAMQAEVRSSLAEFQHRMAGLDVTVAQVEGVGKKQVKAAKLSPDAVMQLAIQLTYHKLSGGGTADTYESCSTSAFKRGRTETVRSATLETAAFCRLLAAGQSSNAELTVAMKACSDAHNRLVKEAAMGQGWDRHLYALRRFAEQSGVKSALFEDPAYARINHIVLSTSTLSSPAVETGGFAPVTRDGFGVGYGILEDMVGVNVTGYAESGGVASARQFGDAFREAVTDIFAVIKGDAVLVHT